MFFDALAGEVPSDLSYDLCIVGAGAAGIALALEFAQDTGTRVCVLEGGGLEYDPDSQDLYRGEIVGRDYDDLDTCRLRYFGGTTNHWAGYCLPFSQNSFERRSWIADSGWPITRGDVTPYYERAHALLGLPTEGGWNPGRGWTSEGLEAHYGSPRLPHRFEHFDENALMISPVRMGEVFQEQLRNAKHIDVLLNANAVEVEVDDFGQNARGVTVRTFAGNSFTVDARMVTVATGGLENVRLLLSSTSVRPDGLGNQNGLVGRYFADHIDIAPGHLVPTNPGLNLSLYQRRGISADTESVVWHEVTPEAQERFELIPCSVRLLARTSASDRDGRRALRQLNRDLATKRSPRDFGNHVMNFVSDIEPIGGFASRYLWYGNIPIAKAVYEMSLAPAPNPDSRVALTGETDQLGMRRLQLDWRLSEIDFRTIRWAATAFADQAAAHGLGRSVLELEDSALSEMTRLTWHHMCTTRMASSPRKGVVDSDCRVHGMDNLYIAGSSVFSTSGWGTPTLMIVALAQRLADHLKGRMAA